MRDGIEQTYPEHPRPKLSYPFEHGPKTGEAVEVADGQAPLCGGNATPRNTLPVGAVARTDANSATVS